MLALDSGKGFFLFAKKARITYLFFITESSKGFESNVNTYLGRGFWQTERLTLDREGNIPFASTAPSNSTRFHLALKGTVRDHLDTPNLRKCHTIIMGGRPGDGDNTETTLRKGEAIVAVTATETRVARLFTGFAASKERFEGQINTDGYILQHLRIHLFQDRTLLFQ
jgi:hypothetical protein